MIMIIKLDLYIKTAYMQEDIDTILPLINESIDTKNSVILDFTNIHEYTTSFFITILSAILLHMSIDEFDEKYMFYNLSTYGQCLFRRSLKFVTNEELEIDD